MLGTDQREEAIVQHNQIFAEFPTGYGFISIDITQIEAVEQLRPEDAEYRCVAKLYMRGAARKHYTVQFAADDLEEDVTAAQAVLGTMAALASAAAAYAQAGVPL
jgi:hypothetical protein